MPFTKGHKMVPWNKGKKTSKLTPEQQLEARKKRTKKHNENAKKKRIMRKHAGYKRIQEYLDDNGIKNTTINGRSIWKYNFQIHKELALNSGVKTQEEWMECCALGFMPEGIYSDPSRVKEFNKK